MTLFQISRGIEANLPEVITDGKMYYCTDTSNLYIDYQESRFQINANFSNGLHYVKEETEIELDAETLISAINSKSTIHFGDTQPENLTEQDLWI